MEMGFGTTVTVIMIMMYHCLDILLIDNENKSIKCLQGTAHGNAEKLHYHLCLQRARDLAKAPWVDRFEGPRVCVWEG